MDKVRRTEPQEMRHSKTEFTTQIAGYEEKHKWCLSMADIAK
jgi:hypothetical protein